MKSSLSLFFCAGILKLIFEAHRADNIYFIYVRVCEKKNRKLKEFLFLCATGTFFSHSQFNIGFDSKIEGIKTQKGWEVNFLFIKAAF